MTVGGPESRVEERELGCVRFSRTVCRQQTEIVRQRCIDKRFCLSGAVAMRACNNALETCALPVLMPYMGLSSEAAAWQQLANTDLHETCAYVYVYVYIYRYSQVAK